MKANFNPILDVVRSTPILDGGEGGELSRLTLPLVSDNNETW